MTDRLINETLRMGFLAGVVGLTPQVAGASEVLTGGAPNLDLDRACQWNKLRAVGSYYKCLLRTSNDTSGRVRCDDRFQQAFTTADRLSPNCPPLDSLDRTRRAVNDQAQAVLVGDVSAPPCQAILSGTDGLVTCQLNAPGDNIGTSVASLTDILTQIQNQNPSTCPDCASVTAETPLWLQAWGASGGNRGWGASVAVGGFAQTVTTISDLQAVGTIALYFYLGAAGGWNNTSGASGGAATLVTTEDLQLNPASDPTDALLIAGGGGGSGGCDSGCLGGCVEPGNGGDGGTAISTGIGQGGDGHKSGGGGGGQGIGGGGSGGGTTGNSGIGGKSGGGGEGAGKHSQGGAGWFNTSSTPLTFTSGAGGGGNGDTNTCTTGGGGGGGGWGGGGGGTHGNTDTAAGGGGGGGSFSIASTCNDVMAPTTYQQSASSNGNVYLVFNTKGTCQ
jgi:hypothetical protein